MSGRIDARLAELGIELPAPADPAANYVPTVRTGKLVYVAGQVPVVDGEFLFRGKVGEGQRFGVEEGQEAARIVAINLLAQLKAACDGDLDRVVQAVKLNGFVNCAPDFELQPHVINGASNLMIEVFGDAGRHARSAVGVAGLPFGVAVEIDGVFEIE
jgi:enamine deaminase RidA (YjgF/YER057c/UK114 family)